MRCLGINSSNWIPRCLGITNKRNSRNTKNKRCLSKPTKDETNSHTLQPLAGELFPSFHLWTKDLFKQKFQFRCQVRVPYIDEAYVVIEVRLFGCFCGSDFRFSWMGDRWRFFAWKAKFGQIGFMWVLEMLKICWVCFCDSANEWEFSKGTMICEEPKMHQIGFWERFGGGWSGRIFAT